MNIVNPQLQFKNPLTPLVLKDVAYIVVHHAEAEHATVQQVHEWHLANGWAGIGYNEYIDKDGTVYIGRGDNVGAHCAEGTKNYNFNSYGICLEGNYDKEALMPEEQFKALIDRLRYHQARFRSATIVPHRKLINTACPGQYFPWSKLMVGITMPVLKFGSTGESVTFLQAQLNLKGFNCGQADGVFGAMTKNAVAKFQTANGLSVDGICGPQTWGKILS